MTVISKKYIIIIIDAWSGGKYLIPAFQALGFYCVHIQSKFVPNTFLEDNLLAKARSDRHIVHDGNINRLVDILRPYPIKALIAGSEGAVSLADELTYLLKLPFSNEYQFSAARRNKFLMQEALKAKQLPFIHQKLITQHQELADWINQHNRWPIVLKPIQSAGTDGVFVCNSIDEAFSAFNTILENRDIFNNFNQHVLCQEFLEGTEFVVNGVACQSHYFFTESWRSMKKLNKANPVYEVQYLCYRQEPYFEELCRYTVQVCQALGLNNGAFHAEIMLTSRGPILIEIGARVAGGADPYIVEECLGHSQISKLVQAVLHPQKFIAETILIPPKTEYAYAAYIYMVSPKYGRVVMLPYSQFLNVSGVVSVNYHYQLGDIQPETKDLISSPGMIIAIQANNDLLDNTISTLRAIENNFYLKGIVET